MGRLINDPELVSRLTGFDSWYHSLPAHLSLDGFRSDLPLVYVPDDGRPTVMMKEIDRTNVELDVGPDMNVIFHNPYFTFDAAFQPSDAVQDVVAAVERVATDEDVLDSALPVALHARLSSELRLTSEQAPHFTRPAYHYTLTRAHVRRAFEPGWISAQEKAHPRINALGLSDSLGPFLDGAGTDFFDSIDTMLEDAGIEVLVISSPLNLQEFTGFPMRLLDRNVWAVVEQGSSEIQVFSRRELPWLEPGKNRTESDYVSRFTRGRNVGYEELDLSIAAFNGFDIDPASAIPATNLLRRWRERRSWRDVAFYVLAADVTLRSVQSALDLVTDLVERGDDVSELAAYRRYRETVHEIIVAERLPLRVETYFTHTHAGNRSLLPARATDFSLQPLTSLKMDAGLLVYDERGIYRAVSDITRSVVGSDEARWFYELLSDALVSGVIASCDPGRTGDEVFRQGMAILEAHRGDIVSAEFAPRVADLTGTFRRDVGHLLGKQEPATVGLKLGDEGTLESGMVGAAEFQWPFRDHCIGVEDVFFVTDQGAINLTRRS